MRLFLFLLILVSPLYLFAQEDPGNSTSAWEKYMKPGKSHIFLMQYEGEWDEEISIWMSPGGQPEKFNVSAVNTMILGGRYFQTKQSGPMAGIPFEGINTLGQHVNNEKFTLTIIDNMGTGTLTLLGFWTTPFKTLELFGDIPTPANTDVVHVRQVINFIDKDNYLIQNFDKRAGHDEYKSAEYRFKRKKTSN